VRVVLKGIISYSKSPKAEQIALCSPAKKEPRRQSNSAHQMEPCASARHIHVGCSGPCLGAVQESTPAGECLNALLHGVFESIACIYIYTYT
jgi:hypothetical protein